MNERNIFLISKIKVMRIGDKMITPNTSIFRQINLYLYTDHS